MLELISNLASFPSGHGSGIVVGTGTKTEFGVIFSMMQDVSGLSNSQS